MSLNHLNEGHHYITIQGYKKIEFEIQNPNANICDWMNDYNQWHIDKDKNLWENNKEGQGIVGLDFSSIPQKSINMNVPTLRRWSNQLTFGHNYKGETNMKNKKMSLHEWFVKYQSDKKVFDKAVKLWFLESQTGTNGFDIDHMRFLLERYNNAIVLKETEKAILIKEYYEEEVQGYYEVSYRLQSIEEWLPKSVLIDEWEEPDKKMINYSKNKK